MAVGKDVVDNDSKCQQTLRHSFAICPIYGLLGVFTEEIKSLLTDQLVLDSLNLAFLHRLAKGLMDNLVVGVPDDVARYELAVHADGLARYAVFQGLLAGDALKALVEQVDACLFLILGHPTTQHVVRVNRRTLLIQRNHSQGTAIKYVEAAVLKQRLVDAAAAFFKDAHGYENADGRIRTTVLLVLTILGKQGAEYLLVDVGGHFTVELVVPGRRVVIYPDLTVTNQVGW